MTLTRLFGSIALLLLLLALSIALLVESLFDIFAALFRRRVQPRLP
jgi:hypothetical protein